MITFEQAKRLLEATTRSESRDHAFGDREIFFSVWFRGREIDAGGGYFGGGEGSIWVHHPITGETIGSFSGEEARELVKCGKVGTIGRNDETGPDTYEDGNTMPGLTKAGVFKELTGHEMPSAYENGP